MSEYQNNFEFIMTMIFLLGSIMGMTWLYFYGKSRDNKKRKEVIKRIEDIRND